ncbi:MAG TPA: hypothetical protein VGH44_02265 [Candidatus Saccharimonadia bacterium]|jgi:hypothetical protein
MKGALINVSLLLLASLPASSNFKLNSYGFGGGGTSNSASANYRVNGLTGEQAGSGSSAHYKVGAGENYVKQANVPIITISNDAEWYDKLKVIIDPQNNPSDAKFAVAISTDNFTTTQYVKSDFTVGSTLTGADYLTYAAWGGATGAMLRGLNRSTVYSVKAKAIHGSFTETDYGPLSSASTVDPYLTFDIDTAATDTSTSPPYQINFGDLLAGSVITATNKLWVSLATNADNGAMVYDGGQNGGLLSGSTGHMIASVAGDLASQTEGYGQQGVSATQTSGGPLSVASLYGLSGTNIGAVYQHLQELFITPGPIHGGRGSVDMLAKSNSLTPASADYTDLMTVVAAGAY